MIYVVRRQSRVWGWGVSVIETTPEYQRSLTILGMQFPSVGYEIEALWWGRGEICNILNPVRLVRQARLWGPTGSVLLARTPAISTEKFELPSDTFAIARDARRTADGSAGAALLDYLSENTSSDNPVGLLLRGVTLPDPPRLAS